jgi:hypothetical protein
MPGKLKEPLRKQLLRARLLHQQDLQEGFGAVELPYALARKLPGAPRDWAWQSFRHQKGRATLARGASGVIICMKACCKKPSS